MTLSKGLRSERHSVSDLQVHLVCVTKYRGSVFTSTSLEEESPSVYDGVYNEESFRDVAAKMNFEVLEFNGESDHVHVLRRVPVRV